MKFAHIQLQMTKEVKNKMIFWELRVSLQLYECVCQQSDKSVIVLMYLLLFLLQVVLGFAFRVYVWLTTSLNIDTKMCYTVNRGYNQPPVQSCEGKHIVLCSIIFQISF